jgi:hypothetical protein
MIAWCEIKLGEARIGHNFNFLDHLFEKVVMIFSAIVILVQPFPEFCLLTIFGIHERIFGLVVHDDLSMQTKNSKRKRC